MFYVSCKIISLTDNEIRYENEGYEDDNLNVYRRYCIPQSVRKVGVVIIPRLLPHLRLAVYHGYEERTERTTINTSAHTINTQPTPRNFDE
jgi:hypothetical protein